MNQVPASLINGTVVACVTLSFKNMKGGTQDRIGGGGVFCTNTSTMTIDTAKQQSNMQKLTLGTWNSL